MTVIKAPEVTAIGQQIQPLRVLKQMAGMVLAAQSEFPTRPLAPLQSFVRSRDQRLPGNVGRFYLYKNISPRGRIASMTSLMFLARSEWPPLIFTEISWPPLGLVFAPNAHPLLDDHMKDITEWGAYGFKQRDSFHFSVPQYKVEVNSPMGFGTPMHHSDWQLQMGEIQLLWGDTGGNNPTQISTLVQRKHRRSR